MKILIIRLSSIGDIVLTTPIIRCLRNQIPNVELHYITKNMFKEIVENNKYIDKVYAFDDDFDAVLQQLKSENYDAIIDLHSNIRSYQIQRYLKVKRVFRYSKQRFKRWLQIQFKLKLLQSHIVDRYFTAVRKLNVINDGNGLDFFIPENEDINISKLPFTHIAGFVVIVVGAKHFTKKIPLAKLEELCRNIKMPIILIGGIEDAYLGTQLSSIDSFKIYNACGKYSITQSASIIKRAKAVITADTGMMHIAASFHKKIFSVWGSTEKSLGFAPYQNSNNTIIIENNQLKCRPCHKHGNASCPKKHFKCMQNLDMQKIVDIINV